MRRLRGIAVAVLAAAGCATAPPVDFAAAPPLGVVPAGDKEQHGDEAPWAASWREVRARWTRTAHVTRDWDTALDARVALASPEYRAAYVRFVAGMRGLSDAGRADLASEQRADGERFVEAWIAMQTSRWEWNDLTSTRTVWTLSFLDGTGRSVESVERAQIALKGAELAEIFPEVTPFTIAWRVRFPTTFADGTPLLPPAGGRARLRFAGPLGESIVEWQAK